MVPHLRYIGQVFGLEVHGVSLVVKFPFTLPICEQPKDFRIVRVFMKTIKGLGVNRLKVVIAVDSFALKSSNTPHTRTFVSTWVAKLA